MNTDKFINYAHTQLAFLKCFIICHLRISLRFQDSLDGCLLVAAVVWVSFTLRLRNFLEAFTESLWICPFSCLTCIANRRLEIVRNAMRK